jgi:hypothetical protein
MKLLQKQSCLDYEFWLRIGLKVKVLTLFNEN